MGRYGIDIQMRSNAPPVPCPSLEAKEPKNADLGRAVERRVQRLVESHLCLFV
jgi:hypothetical protein